MLLAGWQPPRLLNLLLSARLIAPQRPSQPPEEGLASRPHLVPALHRLLAAGAGAAVRRSCCFHLVPEVVVAVVAEVAAGLAVLPASPPPTTISFRCR